jgi:hypothetical protein
MDNGIKNKRYKKFSLKVCEEKKMGKLPGVDIEMILFANDYKFRSHAVKHLTNTIEVENVWKKVLPNNMGSFSKFISSLEEIDCPFLKLRTENPPCHKCRVFRKCTKIISSLETDYLEGMNQIVSQTGILPRYAIYNSNKIKREIFSILSDNKVILKASKIEGDIFNVMTCYAKSESSFGRIVRNEVSKILLEAENQKVQWCDNVKWEVGIGVEDRNKKKRIKKKKPKVPYRRSGGENWKQYLDEMED